MAATAARQIRKRKNKKEGLGWIEWMRGWLYVVYEMLFQRITASHLQNPMPLPPVNDLTCIVTGSTCGISCEIARQLAESGAHVVMAVRNTKAANELIQKWQNEWSGMGLPLNTEEILPKNEVMTEELSVQLVTDDKQEQRMEMEDRDQGEGEGEGEDERMSVRWWMRMMLGMDEDKSEGEGSERISPFDRSQNKIMNSDQGEGEGEDERTSVRWWMRMMLGMDEDESEREGSERISLFDRSQNEIMNSDQGEDEGEGEGEGSERISLFDRSQNEIMNSDQGVGEGEGEGSERISLFDRSQNEIMNSDQGEGEGEGSERISLFDRSQNEIMKLIFAVNYRVPDEGHASFDVHAIFSTSQKIIKDSAKIIHSIIEQGSGFDDVEKPKASSSLCTRINSFGCKMSCKSPGDETAFESRTEEILTRLSCYPCEVQVVLALAVFALEYEECSSQLSKKSTTLKRQDAVVELNNLVNRALQVIEHILELEKLISGDRDSEPKLARVVMDTPFNAYWSIITLVACATELSLLTGDEDIELYDLSRFSQKMGFILKKLEGQLAVCQQEKEEAKAKEKFWELIRTAPPEITEVFQRLVLFEHKAYPQPPIISVDPTNKKVFNINVLEGKWVLFYISSLDNVSDQDISRLKEVYEGIEKHNKCVIVWIPVVEDWTEGGEEQFKEWRSKMPWYAVQYFSPPAIGYLEQRWNFKGNPVVVMMNRKGEVVTSNIIDLIRTQATEAIATRHVFCTHHARFGTTASAVEVLKSLTCPQQSTNTDATPVLLDGFNKQVNIDNELKWKDLFLLLSDVGIEDCYIRYLRQVYEGIRRYPSYRIVWVPVVEQWNQDKEKQLEMSRSNMPWYTLKCLTIPGIKDMKKEWNYKGKPVVVVVTSGGMVKNKNAFPLIKEHGMDAFRFFK